MKDVTAYLDDVNVLGLSFKELLKNLEEVLERFLVPDTMRVPGLKNQLRWGEHFTSQPDAVKSWQVPTVKREV